MIIVTVWILTADQVAQESGKEELATQYHSDERNVEVWGVGDEMTIYAMVEVDTLVDAQADEREEADEEHETAQESEYVHWLLAEVAEEPEGHQVEIAVYETVPAHELGGSELACLVMNRFSPILAKPAFLARYGM